MTWHFTFQIQITHSHLKVYIWGTHSKLSPHSIHLKCSYCPPTLQYTSEVQILPSHLTGFSEVYIRGTDTTLSSYSTYYRCRYHLLNLQYTFEVPIRHSHLTVYISYANMTLPPYHIHIPEQQTPHCHFKAYIWGRYHPLTLQYTLRYRYLTVYLRRADTTLSPYSIHWGTDTLQYTSEGQIPHSHLTVYISYAHMTYPPYYICTSEQQIPHSHLTTYISCADITLPPYTSATDTTLPPHSIYLRFRYHTAPSSICGRIKKFPELRHNLQ